MVLHKRNILEYLYFLLDNLLGGFSMYKIIKYIMTAMPNKLALLLLLDELLPTPVVDEGVVF